MYNILICDDEKDIVNALKIYLTDPDFNFFEASNGKEAVEAVAQSDAAVAAQIEVKKTTRKAARKVKEAVETGVEETKKTVRRAQLNIIIQSPMGGEISTDEIAAKIPKDTKNVYVRVDENMLYWVKGDETGSINIW